MDLIIFRRFVKKAYIKKLNLLERTKNFFRVIKSNDQMFFYENENFQFFLFYTCRFTKHRRINFYNFYRSDICYLK